MPAAKGIFTDAELARVRIINGVDVIDVGCNCGWRGKSSDLRHVGEAYMCPECKSAFSPWPAI